MLLIAKRTAEKLVEEARERAHDLAASAERQRPEILGNAMTEAEQRSSGLRSEVEALERERIRLQHVIAEEHKAFTDLLQRAPHELDRAQAQVVPPPLDFPELLQSRAAPDAPA